LYVSDQFPFYIPTILFIGQGDKNDIAFNNYNIKVDCTECQCF